MGAAQAHFAMIVIISGDFRGSAPKVRRRFTKATARGAPPTT